jgi:hypothetical protein
MMRALLAKRTTAVPGARRRRGFTFVELCLGMIVTAMIMGAVAGIMTAVGEGWSQGQSTQSIQLQANQVFARVQKILSSAKYVGQVTAGSVTDSTQPPGSIFFWRGDDYPNGSTADGTMQWGEMALIQQDPTTHTLFLYKAIPYSQMSGSQLTRAGVALGSTDPSTTNMTTFKALDFVTATAIGGPGNQTDHGDLHVDAAQFYVPTDVKSRLPVIEFALSLSRNGQSTILYDSSTIRAPATQPSWCVPQ